MAYTRDHNFVADTVLVAGVGSATPPRLGISDEIAAAHAVGMALESTQFADGSLGEANLATPRNQYVTHYNFTGRWTPSRYRYTTSPTLNCVVYRQERVLATIAPGVAFHVKQLEIGVSAWMVHAYKHSALMTLGVAAPHVVLRVRLNSPRGGRVCRDLSALDLGVPLTQALPLNDLARLEHDSVAAAMEQRTLRYSVRVGSDDGGVPLLLTDFGATDRIVVAASWRAYFKKDQDIHYSFPGIPDSVLYDNQIAPDGTGIYTDLETAYLTGPSVAVWLSHAFQLV